MSIEKNIQDYTPSDPQNNTEEIQENILTAEETFLLKAQQDRFEKRRVEVLRLAKEASETKVNDDDNEGCLASTQPDCEDRIDDEYQCKSPKSDY